MERKRLVNRVFTAVWILLISLVLVFFLKDRLSRLPQWLKKAKREPQALVPGHRAKRMAGFTCKFDQPSDQDLWLTNQTNLQIVSPPFDSAEKWARVTYYPSQSPGFLWTDETIGLMDWREAESFSFSVYNPQSWEVELKIKVKDLSGRIYQKGERLLPGRMKTVEVPLKQIAERVNAGRVSYLNLFLWEPRTETVLYFTNFAFPSFQQQKLQAGFIRFMGLEFPQAVATGEKIEGTVYFITHQAMSSDHLLLVRLRKGEEAFLLGEVQPPLPTSKWAVGRLIKVGPFSLTVPEDLAEGNYDLEAILTLPLQREGELEYFFQPYENPGLEGHRVGKIKVTGGKLK